MMKEMIHIVVKGRPNSGKTAIAEEIRKVLQDRGFEVALADYNEPARPRDFQEKRLQAASEKTAVQVITQQLLKEPA